MDTITINADTTTYTSDTAVHLSLHVCNTKQKKMETIKENNHLTLCDPSFIRLTTSAGTGIKTQTRDINARDPSIGALLIEFFTQYITTKTSKLYTRKSFLLLLPLKLELFLKISLILIISNEQTRADTKLEKRYFIYHFFLFFPLNTYVILLQCSMKPLLLLPST